MNFTYPLCSSSGLQVTTLTGHTNRVLHLAVSPDGHVSLGELFQVPFEMPTLCSQYLPPLVSTEYCYLRW
jgi:WD40 repeat protein